MNIELEKLELLNFKGIKELTIDFGKETSIYGENATGKTTIFDAFTWLLFGKDSANKSDFNIKILNKKGETIHGLNDQVTGTLIVGDKKVILRRAMKENWVKKRGSADSIFSGNTTEYFINEVPKKEKDYKEFINGIIDENVFKLLTNPLHFNINTSWQDRRKILLSVIGDISDEAVISSSKDLIKLKELLNGNCIEDFKAIISSQKKKLNEQLKAIPIRIDEINRGLPVLAENIDYEEYETKRIKLKDDLKVLENQLTNQHKATENFIKRQSELSTKKNTLKDMELKIEKDSMKQLNNLRLNLMDLEYQQSNLIKKKEHEALNIVKNTEEIERLNNEMEAYRTEYKNVYSETFKEPDRDDFICPTCKQKLPTEDIKNKISEMLESFNKYKNNKLTDIANQGKSRNVIVDRLKTKNDSLQLLINDYEKELMECTTNIDKLKAQIEAESKAEHVVDNNSNTEYKALNEEIKGIEKSLLPISTDNKVTEQYNNAKEELFTIEQVLSSKKAIVDAQERIKELMKEERNYSQQIAELEGQEFLTEQFIKTKVNLLQEKINSTFKYVKFKMFDVQTNGALNDTCQALIEGIPFTDANNAAKINAGIDIINALGKFYDTTAPIFIDNRESVIDLIDTDSQVINLIVSKHDKNLRIEAA